VSLRSRTLQCRAMSIEIRPITEDEFVPFNTATSENFGETPHPERYDLGRPIFEFDRTVAAFDGSRIVGTSGFQSFEMTLPGLTTVPFGGITFVTVAPTHRRRGILTSMMRRLLEDSEARGDVLTGLMSSESIIYGRYGFGQATATNRYSLDTAYRQFARAPAITGRVDLITPVEAADLLPAVYDRVRRITPGQLTHSEAWFTLLLKDLEHWRDGASNNRYAVYSAADNSIDGYAVYRIKAAWEDNFPNSTLTIHHLDTVTAEARAALWQFCLNHDLIRTVINEFSPVDDPLPWMMADPRRMRIVRQEDFLWVCPIEPAVALAARRYAIESRLTLEIEDAFRPAVAGLFTLEGGPDGASCRRSDRSPDLSMTLADLGACYLGGVRFSTLARAGRIVEHTAGALRRADLMFESDPMPFCSTDF
jgi:predicted acetyltransferase